MSRILLILYTLILYPFCIEAYAEEIKSIDDVLIKAEANSPALKSIDLKAKALSSEILARDLELSGVITSQLSAIRDERENFNINNNVQEINNGTVFRNARGKYGSLDTAYIKPFETGTQLSFGVNYNLWESSSVDLNNNQAEWQIRLSQSLWKNAFGSNIDLRRKADQFELRSRFLELLLERQLIKQEIENAFWNLALARKEVEINRQNLNRSQKLYEWIKDRVGRFAAEEADKIQVETLLSERKLDVIIADDSLKKSINTLKQLINNAEPEKWKFNLKLLSKNREVSSLLVKVDNTNIDSQPIQLEALATKNRAEQLELEADRVEDSLKPDLSAYVAYGSNGSDDRFSRSWENAADTDSNMAQIGLIFNIQLDSDLQKESINAAKLVAKSERQKLAAQELKSQVTWQELNRNISNIKKQVAEARRLSDLQKLKVEAEKIRYEQGRSTTFQIVTFELDASSSELRFYRLIADLRKAENLARVFIVADK